MTTIADILGNIRTYAPDADLQPVMSAYLLAAKAHHGQTRKNGEPYLNHPLAVAGILSELRMDVETVATALVHDALEDNPLSKDEMTDAVGAVITELVDGVTKIGKLKFRNKEELQAENFRKMMLATSRDPRVILVKLADRVHNMRTIEHHKPEKQREIAKETLDIFVPIANRLGLSKVKAELEDHCFGALEPEERSRIVAHIESQQADLDRYIARVCTIMSDAMREYHIDADVYGRLKAPYSIAKKIREKGMTLENLHDLIAFRVLVTKKEECYLALGVLHSSFQMVQDKFKDYIGHPKPNGYQSLHTVLLGPEGRTVEVQIRTRDMHRVAEEGVAAHWQYKEGHLALSPDELTKVARVREMFEAARDTQDATEFQQVIRSELFADEVFVRTPAGDVKKFPLGATALDFAYAVHTDVGNTCVGAKVDGRMVPLRYELKSGDRVEILTSSNQKPSRDWLNIAKTGRALSKIKRFCELEEREATIRLGREMVEAELKRFGDSVQKARNEGRLKDIVKKRNARDVDQVFFDVAKGDVPVATVIKKIVPEDTYLEKTTTPYAGIANALLSRFRSKPSGGPSPILITGENGVAVEMARCCNPLPGDAAVGFISRGRGIRVHKATCDQLATLEADRRVPVEWDVTATAKHSGRILIHCNDRPGLLANITQVCEKAGVNINSAEARNLGDQRALVQLELAVRDIVELGQIMKSIEKIGGVEAVDRVGA